MFHVSSTFFKLHPPNDPLFSCFPTASLFTVILKVFMFVKVVKKAQIFTVSPSVFKLVQLFLTLILIEQGSWMLLESGGGG